VSGVGSTLTHSIMGDEDARFELLYSEAVRTLEQQQALVESVRARTGILLSAASIVTSFFAGIALAGGKRLDAPTWAAAFCFVAAGALCLAILWPEWSWTFRFNPKKLVRDYIEADPPATLDEMRLDLSLHVENWAEKNGIKMRWLFRCFEAASILLGAEVVLWMVDLWRM
jgi:hypothetical protein